MGYYNQLLYEKAKAEYDTFLEVLLKKPVEEVISMSYEKVCKEEFVSVLETNSFSEEIAEVLYKLDWPLDAMYQEWLNNDYSSVEFYEKTICELADGLFN